MSIFISEIIQKRITVAVMGAVLFFGILFSSVPMQAQAQSSNDLQAQIDALIKVIQSLENQQAALPEEYPVMLVEHVSSNAKVERYDDTTASDDTGIFTLVFDITAVDDDIYIPYNSAISSDNPGINYSVIGDDGHEIGVSSKDIDSGFASLGSTAYRNDDGTFVIDEGDTEQFTLTVHLDPVREGVYSIKLSNIGYAYSEEYVSLNNFVVREDIDTNKLVINGTNIPRNGSSDPINFPGNTKYTIKNIVKVVTENVTTVSDDDSSYTVYTIQLKNGKEVQVTRFTSDSNKIFEMMVRRTGFVGAMNNFNKFIIDEPTGTVGKIKDTQSPKITGTARNTKLVGFSIDDDEGNQVYGSGEFKVNSRNRWTHKVKKYLANGDYTLTLYTAESVKLATKKFTITKSATKDIDDEDVDDEKGAALNSRYTVAQIDTITVGAVKASSSKVKVTIKMSDEKDLKFKIKKTSNKKAVATRVLKVLKTEKYNFDFSKYSTDTKKVNALKKKVEFGPTGDVLGVSISVDTYTQLGNALTSLNAALVQYMK